ncbi:MAG TPA: M13 family metallopeptidase [Steroidobacteraceae bacterium]|nr:M13 family metallopeptidase [Steroidobacteraceae bacterium]
MHKHLLTPIALVVCAVLTLSGCSNSGQSANPGASSRAASASATPAPTNGAAVAAPASSKASPSAQPIAFDLDAQYSACDDFGDYVNAKWNAAHPIPADQTRWGGFYMLRDQSLQDQKHILETAAQDANDGTGSQLEQQLGNLYTAGMDTATIDKLGYDPIRPKLAAIDALRTPAQIAGFLDTSFNDGNGYVFDFGSGASFKDATQQIGFVNQDGLGLPTPEYYLSQDPSYRKIRAEYVSYIAKALQLAGTPEAAAKPQADQVLALETDLAKASLSPAELLNPSNEFQFVTIAEADRITPHFSWEKFLEAQGVAVGKGLSMAQPKFMAEFDKLLANAPASQWQAYLKFHTISDASPALSEAFQNNHYDFYDMTLGGQPEQKPRWKRVVGMVNDAMGMGLGQLYVARYFSPQAKTRAEQLVANIRAAFREHVEHLTWMSEATKRRALAKLALYLPKIGYPDDGEWRDWSGLKIQPGHFFADLQAAAKYNYHWDLSKIGKKTDRKQWQMTPQTVNAYYDDSTNTINFPAAILQPPFFYAHGDDAVNYGGIGFVIGHETTHGFDKDGSQFDGHGNRVDWWTRQDRDRFDRLTGELEKQYDQYAPIPGKPNLHVDGKLTIREDTADLGGLNIAYTALQNALRANPKEADARIDGETQDQRFFLSAARIWEGTTREKTAEMLLNVDPHAPGKIRAFASASDMPQFAQAFQCKPGDQMVRTGAKLVKIW